jgi:hypothetical protein
METGRRTGHAEAHYQLGMALHTEWGIRASSEPLTLIQKALIRITLKRSVLLDGGTKKAFTCQST